MHIISKVGLYARIRDDGLYSSFSFSRRLVPYLSSIFWGRGARAAVPTGGRMERLMQNQDTRAQISKSRLQQKGLSLNQSVAYIYIWKFDTSPTPYPNLWSTLLYLYGTYKRNYQKRTNHPASTEKVSNLFWLLFVITIGSLFLCLSTKKIPGPSSHIYIKPALVWRYIATNPMMGWFATAAAKKGVCEDGDPPPGRPTIHPFIFVVAVACEPIHQVGAVYLSY